MPLTDLSPREAARLAGLGYAAIFILAIFANFAVRTRLVDLEDPAATLDNIAASEGLFRVALAAFVVVFALDVLIAWALYVLFRPAGPRRSLLAAWLRLTYTVFLGVAAVFVFLALQLATGAPYVDGVDPGLLASLAALSLDAFNYTWLVGLVAFGLHLIVIGRMILSSRVAPRALGGVLALAGTAYIVDTLAQTLLPDYASWADLFLAVVAVPSVLGELGFTIWLLASGRTRSSEAAHEGAGARPIARAALAGAPASEG
ncbi:DUF4386 domain-containing protein [uncultured Cellulomonas sp.]|uniref:DUF4386 domain-containing protein n=1 Tax=uncultured Cellulomonas sp. TaxID=189682 RepID=UPI00260A272A|nr:DUF4386 domain-containing protein [uncultured Cellulomonas sp.]